MYLCYIDESGTSEIPGNTSHFVLAGLSLPISFWRTADREISLVLGRYGLENEEGWGYARLFAECVDKTHFDPMRTKLSVDEQAFEQVVSRFQQYLSRTATTVTPDETTVRDYGVLIHDNNESVAKKHTQLMRQFHKSGTLWTTIDNIIETPLFVDSSLTRMVQMADLCAVALRRYCENKETDLFRRIFQRADRFGGRAVGVRHFAGLSCQCEICEAHRRPTT